MVSPLNANLPANLPPIGPRRIVYLEANRAPTALDTKYRDGSYYEQSTEWRDNHVDPPDIWKLVKIYSSTNALWLKILAGSGALDSIQVDRATAPGVNPVTPDINGLVTILATAVNAHDIPIETHTSALNSFKVELQYASGNATSNAAKSGICHFNNTQFSVNADGFVELAGGGLAIDEIKVDAFTGPGTDPVKPTAAGRVIVTGAQVPAGTTTNVIRTNSLAANTYTIEIQRSATAAATTIGSNGVSHYNSAQFTIDGNGFVGLVGSSTTPAAMSFVVQANTAPGVTTVTPTALGVVTVNAAAVAQHGVPIETRSRALNAYNIEVQYSGSAATVDATKNGVCHFDSDIFTVDADGFVSTSGGTLVQAITGGPGITITGTPANPIVNSVIFTDSTATTMAVDNGYFATAAGTFNLPATAQQGELIHIVDDVGGGVIVDAPALNFIRIGSSLSAASGTATSTAQGDSLTLRYRAATLTWHATSVTGIWVVA